jgi:hypothetical protein
MPQTGSFGDVQFTNLKGTAISWCFTPGLGFQDHSWVYTADVVDAKQRPTPVRLGPAGTAPVGNLLISGENRAYQFPDITLNSVEAGATRRERFRVCEFHYPHTPGVAQKVPAVLQNQSQMVLKPGALGKDYEWGVDAFPQQLLGFRARLAANDSVVVRFAALRNAHNSLLERFLAANNQQAQNANQAMPDIPIRFAQGNITVTGINLVRAFITEAYGEALRWPLPTMSDYLEPIAGPQLARLNPPCHSAHDHVRDEVERGFHPPADNFTVEVTTLVFVPGYYRELVIA